MGSARFDYSTIVRLLGSSITSPEVISTFGDDLLELEIDLHYGTLEYRSEGVGVIFNLAPWVLPAALVRDKNEFVLRAFHLYRNGYKDFGGYSGTLPRGVTFEDCEEDIIMKFGAPISRGGGKMLPILNYIAHNWILYQIGNYHLHFQFGDDSRLELITPQMPRLYS